MGRFFRKSCNLKKLNNFYIAESFYRILQYEKISSNIIYFNINYFL